MASLEYRRYQGAASRAAYRGRGRYDFAAPLPQPSPEPRCGYEERRSGTQDWQPIDTDTLRQMIGTKGRGWRAEFAAMKAGETVTIGGWEYRWTE